MTDDECVADAWIDRHSVNCYFCGSLIDERDALPADPYNGNDGGDICQRCLPAVDSILFSAMEAQP